ncbi:hypothetical protein F0562_018587 [Nyssa sinensis]|uniref:Pectinesterase inhibitor domain-containing protein n=1 Tax=Nyssa sinensis TaxID=561372 RepID=A0A5J4ZDH0_9ASTE|nr:hypothetical protein F0562_018587 [Nyssa sinensis]
MRPTKEVSGSRAELQRPKEFSGLFNSRPLGRKWPAKQPKTFVCANGDNLIQDTCKICAQNDPNVKFDFCTTTLQAAPGSNCTSLHGLGMISIRLIRYNVTDTRCYIKQLLNDTKFDPYVKACLSDCFDLYSDAIPSVDQAMKYYDSKRYDDADIHISAVMDAATTCEDGFSEKEGAVSPLMKRDDDMFQLSALALSIMHMLWTGSH